MTLSELNKRMRSLDILELLAECIEENSEYLVDLNTSQLAKGKDSKGENLMDYATPEYSKLKKAMGSQAPFGIPNLYLEGDFYEGFFAEPLKADKGGAFISSTDSKTAKLSGKYGNNIFGLTDESKKDFKTILLPELLNKTRHELFR